MRKTRHMRPATFKASATRYHVLNSGKTLADTFKSRLDVLTWWIKKICHWTGQTASHAELNFCTEASINNYSYQLNVLQLSVIV